MKKISFFTLIISLNSLFSYQEVETLSDIKLSEDVLVIFDVDDTLMRPSQQLGSEAWALHHLETMKSNKVKPDLALKRLARHWEKVQKKTKVELLEKMTPTFLSSLQERNIPSMGITLRFPKCADLTAKQLKKLKINLSKTAPFKDIMLFSLKNEVQYRNGILYISPTNTKALALDSFFKKAGLNPEKIIYIDNSLEQVKAFEEHFTEKKDSLHCYHYKPKNAAKFSPEVTEIQWKYMGQILQDEKAEKLRDGRL